MLVLCSGMQRSGSTLQYELVKKILNFYEKSFVEYGYAQIGDENSVLNFLGEEKAEFHLVKTHDLLDLNEVKKVVIYSWRDIRDVAASIKNKFGKKDKILLTTIDQCVEEHYKIISSADIVQIYNSLVNNKPKCIEELAVILGFNINSLNAAIIIDSLKRDETSMKKFSILGSIKTYLLKWINTPIAKDIASKLHLSKAFKEIIRSNLVQHSIGSFHYGHITKNNGMSGTYNKYLTDTEINYLDTYYQDLYLDEKK